jgi:hypothetical protein
LVATAATTSSNIYVLSEIEMKSVVYERKMKVGYGIEEWVTCILITFSKLEKEKQSDKCPRSRNQPILYASIANKERKQRPGSNQMNIQQQNH